MASETGVPSAILFTALVAYLLAGSFAVARSAATESEKRWLTGVALGMLGLFLHLLPEPLANDNLTYTYMGLVASAVALSSRDPLPFGVERERQPRPT
jgi:hypothetical protein